MQRLQRYLYFVHLVPGALLKAIDIELLRSFFKGALQLFCAFGSLNL